VTSVAQKSHSSPRKTLGDFRYTDNNVKFQTDKSSVEVMVGTVWMTDAIYDPNTKQQSYLLAGRSAMEESFSVRVPADKLRNANAFADIVGHYGVHVLKTGLAVQLMVEWVKYLGAKKDEYPQRELVTDLGWHQDGKLFYDGAQPMIATDLDPNRYYFEPKYRPPVANAGTLKGWQEQVLPLAWANPTLLVMLHLGMLSPFLPFFQTLSSRLVNWHGLKGTGKTLGLQVAATLFGNGIDPATGGNSKAPPFVRKFKATANAIELIFAETSPFPALLDELTEVKRISEVIDVIYLTASGIGKKRMQSNLKAAADNIWLQSIQTTSEHSIANAALLANRPLNGGEEDRAIDIKVDSLGIITNLCNFASFGEAAGHLKRACAEQYGTAGPALIEYFINNRDEVQAYLDLLPETAEKLAPAGCGDGEMRVVRHFAAAVIVGYIAIAAGIFPEDPDHIEDAFRKVINVWWTTRANSLQKLALFLDLHLPQIVFCEPNRTDKPVAFVHGNFITIPDYIFEAEFGSEHRGMLKQLYGIGALYREQEGRNRYRYCDGDLYGFTFDREKVARSMVDSQRLFNFPKKKESFEEAMAD